MEVRAPAPRCGLTLPCLRAILLALAKLCSQWTEEKYNTGKQTKQNLRKSPKTKTRVFSEGGANSIGFSGRGIGSLHWISVGIGRTHERSLVWGNIHQPQEVSQRAADEMVPRSQSGGLRDGYHSLLTLIYLLTQSSLFLPPYYSGNA